MFATEYIDTRLEDWSHWARGPTPGAISSSVGYMRERLDKGLDSDEMTPAIEITERALAKTKIEHIAYWRVISRYYLSRFSEMEIAAFFGLPEDRIKRLRLQALSRVGEHIEDLERGLT